MLTEIKEAIKPVFAVSCFRHIHLVSGRKERRERAETRRLHFNETFTSSFLERKNIEAEMVALSLCDMLNALCQCALSGSPQSLVFKCRKRLNAGLNWRRLTVSECG